jgi:hypothetical protein
MEYLIGFLTAFAAVTLYPLLLSKTKSHKDNTFRIKHSQSKSFGWAFSSQEFVKKPTVLTQATKYSDKKHVRVVFSGPKAYWITNNVFYEASHLYGLIDTDSARAVDTMGLDGVQLKRMMMIVEALSEGNINDSGDSGYKSL